MNTKTDFFAYKDSIGKQDSIELIPVFSHSTDGSLYTISITVYQRKQFLKQCLESALHQVTTIPYEVVVIDDNPVRDDEVENMMKDYEAEPRLSYYKKSANEGLMNNMNRSIVVAKTDWVVMIHDDDWLCLDYIEKIDAYRHQYPSYSIYVPSKHTFYFDQQVNTKGTIHEKLCALKKVWGLKPLSFWGATCVTPTGSLYHREKFIQSGGFNEEFGMAADYVFFARYSSYEKILRINEKLFNYRYAENESLKPATIDNFRVVGHYLNLYLMNKYHWLSKRFRDIYEKSRLWNDFHEDVSEIERLFPEEEVRYYKNTPYFPFVFKMISLYVKASSFVRR